MMTEMEELQYQIEVLEDEVSELQNDYALLNKKIAAIEEMNVQFRGLLLQIKDLVGGVV